MSPWDERRPPGHHLGRAFSPHSDPIRVGRAFPPDSARSDGVDRAPFGAGLLIPTSARPHRRPEAARALPGRHSGADERRVFERRLDPGGGHQARAGEAAAARTPADDLPPQGDAHRIAALPIDEGAMTHPAGLPALHRDPFGRLLIAQAFQHRLMIGSVHPTLALGENLYGNSSTDAAGSDRNPRTSAALDRNKASTCRVGPLPTRNQITFGGGP